MTTDSFTNTNGTALTTHNSAWVYISHAGWSDSGRIYNNGVSFSAWNEGGYYRNDSTSDESQIVLLSGEPGDVTKVRPAIRASADTLGYHYILNGSGSNWVSLYLFKNNSWLANTAISYDKGVNHTLRIVASGTTSPVTITAYIDSTLILTYQDSSSPYTSGAPGITLMGNGSNNYAFGDDWTDNAVVASTTLPRRALDGPLYGSLRGSIR